MFSPFNFMCQLRWPQKMSWGAVVPTPFSGAVCVDGAPSSLHIGHGTTEAPRLVGSIWDVCVFGGTVFHNKPNCFNCLDILSLLLTSLHHIF